MTARRLALLLAALIASASAHARPILTEEVPTVGRFTFETEFSASKRFDEFGRPVTRYQSVSIPFRAGFGLTNTFDFGLSLQHLSQQLDTGPAKFSGSRTALLTPYVKFSPFRYVGVQAIWYAAIKEESSQDLPIARGDDFETTLLIAFPLRWPVTLNAGYVFKDGYTSRLGVSNATLTRVEPGNIFVSKAALEIPTWAYFSLLGEVAYYKTDKKNIGGVEIPDSEGEAMDAVAGVTWSRYGWNIGLGAAWGLMEESHTSFDLERGAGDVTYMFTAAYKLKPKKPTR